MFGAKSVHITTWTVLNWYTFCTWMWWNRTKYPYNQVTVASGVTQTTRWSRRDRVIQHNCESRNKSLIDKPKASTIKKGKWTHATMVWWQQSAMCSGWCHRDCLLSHGCPSVCYSINTVAQFHGTSINNKTFLVFAVTHFDLDGRRRHL